MVPIPTPAPIPAPGTNVQILVLAKDSRLPRPTETGQGFIKVIDTPKSTTCEDSLSFNLDVPHAGTYYVWLHLKASEPGRNALVFGVDGSEDRVSADVAGAFEWVRVQTSDGSGRHNFELQQGSHAFRCGPGEADAELDAIYLTNNPNPSAPGVGVPTKEPTATAVPCSMPQIINKEVRMSWVLPTAVISRL